MILPIFSAEKKTVFQPILTKSTWVVILERLSWLLALFSSRYRKGEKGQCNVIMCNEKKMSCKEMVFGQCSDTETKKIVRGKSCSRQERCGKRQGWKLELPAEDKAQIWEIGKETFLLI